MNIYEEINTQEIILKISRKEGQQLVALIEDVASLKPRQPATDKSRAAARKLLKDALDIPCFT